MKRRDILRSLLLLPFVMALRGRASASGGAGFAGSWSGRAHGVEHSVSIQQVGPNQLFATATVADGKSVETHQASGTFEGNRASFPTYGAEMILSGDQLQITTSQATLMLYRG